MKIKSNFIIKHILNSDVVIDVTGGSKSIIKLNETASFMFNLLKQGIGKQELISKMLENYDADRELIEKDVDDFINKLEKLEMFEK